MERLGSATLACPHRKACTALLLIFNTLFHFKFTNAQTQARQSRPKAKVDSGFSGLRNTCNTCQQTKL